MAISQMVSDSIVVGKLTPAAGVSSYEPGTLVNGCKPLNLAIFHLADICGGARVFLMINSQAIIKTETFKDLTPNKAL